MYNTIELNPGKMPVLEYLEMESMGECRKDIMVFPVFPALEVLDRKQLPKMSRMSDLNWIGDCFLVTCWPPGTCPSPLFNDRVNVMVKRMSARSLSIFVCNDVEWIWVTQIKADSAGAIDMMTSSSVNASGNPVLPLGELVEKVANLVIRVLAEARGGGLAGFMVGEGKECELPGTGLNVSNGLRYPVRGLLLPKNIIFS